MSDHHGIYAEFVIWMKASYDYFFIFYFYSLKIILSLQEIYQLNLLYNSILFIQ